MPSCFSWSRANFPRSLSRRSRPFTRWPCALTKSCKDSHRLRAKCGRLRRLLKLRRSTMRLLFSRAAEPPLRYHYPLCLQAVIKLDTSRYDSRRLAVYVHFCAAEKPAEWTLVPKKVLIVDDSPAQVKLIQGLLEPEGYWPVGLSDPKRVEEAITVERPSLILLDVVMPGRNGFQVCRELKENVRFNAIPVILVTSKDTASDRYWGQQQGADGYVTKPFTREELLRAVRRFA